MTMWNKIQLPLVGAFFLLVTLPVNVGLPETLQCTKLLERDLPGLSHV